MSTEVTTLEQFRDHLFDYTKDSWTSLASVPVVIDFYAEWCGPCKILSPILEDLEKQFGERFAVYKVDTDRLPDVASAIGIQSLPTLVYLPVQGNQGMTQGVLSRKQLLNTLKQNLGLEIPAI